MEEHASYEVPAMDLVFVYGSLKRGQANHHLLTRARFEGEAQAAGLVLHDLGPFPMAIAADQSPAGGTCTSVGQDMSAMGMDAATSADALSDSIEGEVFAVDGETLAQLDRLEGVPRLYQRLLWPLHDGRQAWLYLGQPRQVRYVPALPAGRWPALLIPLLLVSAFSPAGLRAETSLADCNRWRSSHGQARIELGNRIGAASYLTKRQRLQESPPEAPVALYAESDLERACNSAS
jgi:gamma-glutamylcyclotransferase (GGCT)/AIG2-like uncharacterized protein YtfP